MSSIPGPRAGDFIAGLCLAGLLLPEAVAYASIAGLPPQHGIFAAVAGCFVYGLAGRSRFAIVSPTSSSAAILAATLATLPDEGAVKLAATTVVVALVGGFLLLAAVARLGNFTGFVSRPVLRGFAFGLAVTIIVRQLPHLVGVEAASTDIFHLVPQLVLELPQWNPFAVAAGGTALAVLLALRRFPAIPGAFVVLAGGVAASTVFGLEGHGVSVVGTIDIVPAWPSWPSLGWADYSQLARFALPLVLILFAESWGTIRALSLRHGEAVDADRELAAIGLANMASALAQGMPVGAGFSAGNASEAAGAATRATAFVTALGLAILVIFGGSFVARLPEPVLAAVVIAALVHALDPAPLARLWTLGRDQYVAVAAAVAVLALGVLNGMLVAIALSLTAVVQRLAAPQVAQLGRLGTTHDYVDLARHPDAVAPQGIAIWRPAQPLFFANADRIMGIIAASSRAEPGLHAVVVSLEESFDLDSTALDALVEFDAVMRQAGLRLQLARAHDRVRDLLAAAGARDLVARCSYSVDDAVAAVQP
ncbi:SulP family inorganic anion transporter [Xanthobacter versatilis]|uniref:SulP family inorganic anion transporter n=1 Tax=Xanthobacter autotrophicus (strain ATCC BAA-1158 / Py2) TaxID=78245 RepID=UPI00372B4139